MADHFLGALKEIERRAQNNILVFSDVLSERLDVIAQSMISKPLSDNDYLKLAELYYKKFSKDLEKWKNDNKRRKFRKKLSCKDKNAVV